MIVRQLAVVIESFYGQSQQRSNADHHIFFSGFRPKCTFQEGVLCAWKKMDFFNIVLAAGTYGSKMCGRPSPAEYAELPQQK